MRLSVLESEQNSAGLVLRREAAWKYLYQVLSAWVARWLGAISTAIELGSIAHGFNMCIAIGGRHVEVLKLNVDFSQIF